MSSSREFNIFAHVTRETILRILFCLDAEALAGLACTAKCWCISLWSPRSFANSNLTVLEALQTADALEPTAYYLDHQSLSRAMPSLVPGYISSVKAELIPSLPPLPPPLFLPPSVASLSPLQSSSLTPLCSYCKDSDSPPVHPPPLGGLMPPSALSAFLPTSDAVSSSCTCGRFKKTQRPAQLAAQHPILRTPAVLTGLLDWFHFERLEQLWKFLYLQSPRLPRLHIYPFYSESTKRLLLEHQDVAVAHWDQAKVPWKEIYRLTVRGAQRQNSGKVQVLRDQLQQLHEHLMGMRVQGMQCAASGGWWENLHDRLCTIEIEFMPHSNDTAVFYYFAIFRQAFDNMKDIAYLNDQVKEARKPAPLAIPSPPTAVSHSFDKFSSPSHASVSSSSSSSRSHPSRPSMSVSDQRNTAERRYSTSDSYSSPSHSGSRPSMSWSSNSNSESHNHPSVNNSTSLSSLGNSNSLSGVSNSGSFSGLFSNSSSLSETHLPTSDSSSHRMSDSPRRRSPARIRRRSSSIAAPMPVPPAPPQAKPEPRSRSLHGRTLSTLAADFKRLRLAASKAAGITPSKTQPQPLQHSQSQRDAKTSSRSPPVKSTYLFKHVQTTLATVGSAAVQIELQRRDSFAEVVRVHPNSPPDPINHDLAGSGLKEAVTMVAARLSVEPSVLWSRLTALSKPPASALGDVMNALFKNEIEHILYLHDVLSQALTGPIRHGETKYWRQAKAGYADMGRTQQFAFVWDELSRAAQIELQLSMQELQEQQRQQYITLQSQQQQQQIEQLERQQRILQESLIMRANALLPAPPQAQPLKQLRRTMSLPLIPLPFSPSFSSAEQALFQQPAPPLSQHDLSLSQHHQTQPSLASFIHSQAIGSAQPDLLHTSQAWPHASSRPHVHQHHHLPHPRPLDLPARPLSPPAQEIAGSVEMLSYPPLPPDTDSPVEELFPAVLGAPASVHSVNSLQAAANRFFFAMPKAGQRDDSHSSVLHIHPDPSSPLPYSSLHLTRSHSNSISPLLPANSLPSSVITQSLPITHGFRPSSPAAISISVPGSKKSSKRKGVSTPVGAAASNSMLGGGDDTKTAMVPRNPDSPGSGSELHRTRRQRSHSYSAGSMSALIASSSRAIMQTDEHSQPAFAPFSQPTMSPTLSSGSLSTISPYISNPSTKRRFGDVSYHNDVGRMKLQRLHPGMDSAGASPVSESEHSPMSSPVPRRTEFGADFPGSASPLMPPLERAISDITMFSTGAFPGPVDRAPTASPSVDDLKLSAITITPASELAEGGDDHDVASTAARDPFRAPPNSPLSPSTPVEPSSPVEDPTHARSMSSPVLAGKGGSVSLELPVHRPSHVHHLHSQSVLHRPHVQRAGAVPLHTHAQSTPRSPHMSTRSSSLRIHALNASSSSSGAMTGDSLVRPSPPPSPAFGPMRSPLDHNTSHSLVHSRGNADAATTDHRDPNEREHSHLHVHMLPDGRGFAHSHPHSHSHGGLSHVHNHEHDMPELHQEYFAMLAASSTLRSSPSPSSTARTLSGTGGAPT